MRIGEIRIIGGQLKRSKLQVPPKIGLRPTPDRVRETVFNWLMPYLPGARTIDLFAGTGALGIESISRGADFAQFVETDAELAQAIRANAERLKIADRIAVSTLGAARFLQANPQGFDIAFIDPPYADDRWSMALDALPQWLNAGAVVYLEHPDEREPPFDSRWRPLKEARAGAIRFWLLAENEHG
jgi:16S rRNA (guanine966-N2)-methyltransferase